MVQAYRLLKKHGSMYVVSGYSQGHIVQTALLNIGFVLINEIICQYNFPIVAKHKYNSSHYRIYYCKKSKSAQPTFNPHCRFNPDDKGEDGKAVHWKDMSSVWHIKKEPQRGRKKNLVELPNELVQKMLAYSSNENDLVADFFLGSGTVPIQAWDMNRRVIGFEKNLLAFQHSVSQLKMAERDAEVSRQTE
jgi:site-specific DNA-methyltransferase (adenine-specific)